jgi:hypothetical protein
VSCCCAAPINLVGYRRKLVATIAGITGDARALRLSRVVLLF